MITVKNFTELTNSELYQLLKLRQDIFVLEQTCLYPDIDGRDPDALHVLFEENSHLAAYCRLLEVPKHNHFIRLGRIIVDPKYRGKQLGKQLIMQVIEYIKKNLNKTLITISAQTPLINFYQECGFKVVSAPYDEDGIEHIDMHLALSIN